MFVKIMGKTSGFRGLMKHLEKLVTAGSFIFLFVSKLYFLTAPLWHDESWRIMKIIDINYINTSKIPVNFLPLGFVWVTKLSLVLFGNNEFVIRFPMLVASMVLAYLMYQEIKTKVPQYVALLIILAFNHIDIVFSHSIQFKQLILEAALFFLGYLIIYRIDHKNYVQTLFKLFILNIFALNIVLLYPYYFIWCFFNLRILKLRSISTILVQTVVIITMNFLILIDKSSTADPILLKYWAEYFLDIKSPILLENIITKNLGLLNLFLYPQPGFLLKQPLFILLMTLSKIIFVTFVVYGAIQSIKTRSQIFLVASPFAITTVLAFIYKWPLGDNRVNLFVMPLLVWYAVIGFSVLSKRTLVIKIAAYSVIAIMIAPVITSCLKTVAKYHVPYIYYKVDIIGGLPDRISDGMKCAVKNVVQNQKPGDTILAYHFLSEPLLGYYYHHYNWPKSMKTASNITLKNKIYNNEDYNETYGRGYLPDRSEKFFRDKLKNGDLYIIMIVGTDSEFAGAQLSKAYKFGKLVEFVPCKGYVNMWHVTAI